MTADINRSPEQVTAYVALGSNIGDREAYLRQAIDALSRRDGIEVAALSAMYETEPVGYVDQAAFLNMVIELSTSLPPEQLLLAMQGIESSLGRTRDVHWGPRTVDLDLLLYGDIQLTAPDLIIPHPRMQERAFVLIPLADVLQQRQAGLLASITEQLERLEGKEGVTLWKKVQ
ncbi:2-amino-4-hydroxy-6-hydroxymethyldihydropteridine diphosphokinase [Paenibacillus athensensis]|uniref:2-amino-4-hydroxy-6-hydroxymethyldihydropteridine diphosphokinase n=1 Tax=Paenibacillus athensensis TaxID=1967502 RepID=A0A4Y8PVL4_9BACL|nr:2-amino-4-hydroxy-6-hydroxymethyldihydropteridine diphosphokinase [Paenibacillus athensensis]MCD1261859.1 2-amino-4-hydroxy-6-hydroxymethyldihydropteridine diphosphokinase [Paenibacillus athensensis]